MLISELPGILKNYHAICNYPALRYHFRKREHFNADATGMEKLKSNYNNFTWH